MTALVLLFWALPAFWPSGTFQGKVSYGPINQRVTVKTDKSAVGTGEITLRGFINARDDFSLRDNTVMFGNELAEKLNRVGITLSEFDIGSTGAIITLNTPIGKKLNLTLEQTS